MIQSRAANFDEISNKLDKKQENRLINTFRFLVK